MSAAVMPSCGGKEYSFMNDLLWKSSIIWGRPTISTPVMSTPKMSTCQLPKCQPHKMSTSQNVNLTKCQFHKMSTPKMSTSLYTKNVHQQTNYTSECETFGSEPELLAAVHGSYPTAAVYIILIGLEIVPNAVLSITKSPCCRSAVWIIAMILLRGLTGHNIFGK